jgi:2-polyprenyl-3-methyl-5-hydroxy-6-metoxy-1,4-benzoquinol methylase
MLKPTPDTDKNCPVCGSAEPPVAYWQTPRFGRCGRCDAIFRLPFPDESELNNLYQASWSCFEEHVDETGGTSAKFGRTVLSALLSELGDRGLTGKHILDFGAGRGGMSAALRERGAEVTAVEPYGHAQLKQLGVPVYRSVEELPEGMSFDGIILMEVIEHLREPCSLLRQLSTRLKPGGWLFLTTPNPRGLTARLYGQRWSSASNAGHIVFFTRRTLYRVLCEVGFGEVRQAQWVLRFPDSRFPRSMAQRVLQLLRVGGGLRFLALMRSSGSAVG